MKPKPKMYIVRKYVKALSAADAIKKERGLPVDEIFIDDEWRKSQPGLADAIGFGQQTESE